MDCLRPNFATCETVGGMIFRGMETTDSFRLIPLTNIPMTIFSFQLGSRQAGPAFAEAATAGKGEFPNCALNFGDKLALLTGRRGGPIRRAEQNILRHASFSDE